MSIAQENSISAPAPPVPWWSALALLVALCIALQLRLHSQTEPLDCDESAYAYVGHRLLLGDRLYGDVFENKPPVAYALYALGIAAGGYDEHAIRLLPVPFVLGTVFFTWLFAQRFAGSAAAASTVLLYSMVSSDPFVFADSANLEVFMAFFVSVALWGVGLASSGGAWKWCIVAGIAAGCATAIKQVSVLHVCLFGFWLTFSCARRGDWARTGRVVAGFAAGFMLPWLCCLAFLSVQGTLREFVDGVFIYGPTLTREAGQKLVQDYVQRELNTLPSGLSSFIALRPGLVRFVWLVRGNPQLGVWWGSGSWPLLLLAAGALGYVTAFGRTELFWLTVATALMAYAEIEWTGLFWQHYYILPVPCLAIIAGTGIGRVIERLDDQLNDRRWIHAASSLLILVASGWLGARVATIQVKEYLWQTPEQICARHKAGNQWIALRKLGGKLARFQHDHTKLFVWGWQSPLHVYSGIDSITPYFFTDPFMQAQNFREHPMMESRRQRIMSDLNLHQPEFILVGELPFPELVDFLGDRYRFISPNADSSVRDGRGLYARQDMSDRLDAALRDDGNDFSD